MFTGIIEEIGVIREMRFLSEGAIITVAASVTPAGMKVGNSICVNGVCLTVTRVGSDFFLCDISAETLLRSNFKQAKQGMRINLERAMAVGDRLGGHFVQGHVDGVGRLIAKTATGDGFQMSFEFPNALERYLVFKGSIAVNGISLTISALEKGSFSASIIPLTLKSTNLNLLAIGDLVNLEVDILGKYFERFFDLGLAQSPRSGSKISPEYLKSQGF